MSVINNPTESSILDFINNTYAHAQKDIIFWDTCALLEILRFPYRGGDVNTYRILNKINGLIQSDDIYSLASSLTITEWNDHQQIISDETQNSLVKTGNYHRNCLDIINEIFTQGYASESIHDKMLVQSFETLANNILSKTIFIETEEIANKALKRVEHKLPPASKKQEFKDCAVWETIIKLSRDIYAVEQTQKQVFFTVNTNDFIDKSREPRQFHGSLLSEASMSNLVCCYKFDEVNLSL